MSCPLCRLYMEREILTELLYEDDVCIAVYCATHPSKKMVVLKRHTLEPSKEELYHLLKVAHRLGGNYRDDCLGVPEHYHLHEI